jgi:hypothetical protein
MNMTCLNTYLISEKKSQLIHVTICGDLNDSTRERSDITENISVKRIMDLPDDDNTLKEIHS